MKIVIDVPNNMDLRNYDIPYDILKIITDGKPLPEHHGRLIDADDIRKDSLHVVRHEKGDDVDVYIDAPTILEAER